MSTPRAGRTGASREDFAAARVDPAGAPGFRHSVGSVSSEVFDRSSAVSRARPSKSVQARLRLVSSASGEKSNGAVIAIIENTDGDHRSVTTRFERLLRGTVPLIFFFLMINRVISRKKQKQLRGRSDFVIMYVQTIIRLGRGLISTRLRRVTAS